MEKRIYNIVVIIFVALFVACDNDESAYYYSNDVQETKYTTSLVEASHLKSDINYEVIPVGNNNYVYLPKMTSAKAVTRSAEIARTYSATINGGVSSHYGGFTVTVTWSSDGASYSLSEGYTASGPHFVYDINGSTIDVLLSFTVWCDGVRIGDFEHSGTLRG